MKSAAVVLSLLASVAVAQPHVKHQHAQYHKRADGPVVEWVTSVTYTTEIVPVTTTIWVSEGFVPPTTSPSGSTSTKASVPAQFFQPASKSRSSSSVYVAPASVSTSVPPPVAPAPKAPETSTSTPSPPAPSPEPVNTPEPTPESVYTPPAPTTTYAAPPPASSAPPSGPSTGECSKASPCEGDITHYDANAGTGACGWNSDGKNENVIALPHGMMGVQSNGNPYCGKSVTITYGGKSIIAKIVDKCMGCKGNSIDLSEHGFSELLDMGVGRAQATWYFN